MKRQIIRDKDTQKLKYSRRVTKEITDDYTVIFANYYERLDRLAYQYYGDASLWKVIAKANNMRDIFVKDNNELKIPLNTTRLEYIKE